MAVQPMAPRTSLQHNLLYRGSFLPGFSIGGAAPFEEWALLRREQISLQVMSLLSNLAAYCEARGDYPAAQAHARQQIALEPWSEEAHRTLIRVLTLDGQRSAALRQYCTCRDLLRDELGVEPTEETVALYEAIRAGMVVDRETRRQGNKETRKQGGQGTSFLPCLLVYLFPQPRRSSRARINWLDWTITLQRALPARDG